MKKLFVSLVLCFGLTGLVSASSINGSGNQYQGVVSTGIPVSQQGTWTVNSISTGVVISSPTAGITAYQPAGNYYNVTSSPIYIAGGSNNAIADVLQASSNLLTTNKTLCTSSMLSAYYSGGATPAKLVCDINGNLYVSVVNTGFNAIPYGTYAVMVNSGNIIASQGGGYWNFISTGFPITWTPTGYQAVYSTGIPVTISGTVQTISTGSVVTVSNFPTYQNVTSTQIVTLSSNTSGITIYGSSNSIGVTAYISGTPNVTVTNTVTTVSTFTVNGSSITVNFATPQSVNINNSPTIANTSFTVVNQQFLNKVSSGTSGLITGVASQTIVISDNVKNWAFKVIDSNLTTSYMTIEPSIWGSRISLKDGDVNNESVEIGAPVTFYLRNLNLSTSVQYTIRTVK